MRPTALLLRLLAAAALGYSAYVHLHLAGIYDGVGGTITQGDLFRVQGSLAILLALVVLVTGNVWAWRAAAVLGLATVAAVVVYRYVDVGAIGPIPNMYDGSWQPSPQKALSAVAEGTLVLWWLLTEFSRRGGRAPRAAGS